MVYFTTQFSTTAITGSGANSTDPGASAIANLNWIGGKPTTVALSFSSSTTNCDITIQYTLDDIQRVASTTVIWASVASSSGTVAHFGSTTFFDPGVSLTFLNPIAAVRMNSTTLSSGIVYLKVLQGEGW
jgi:hypothetical protein